MTLPEPEETEHAPDCMCDECWAAYKRSKNSMQCVPSAPGVPGDMGTDPSRRVDRE